MSYVAWMARLIFSSHFEVLKQLQIIRILLPCARHSLSAKFIDIGEKMKMYVDGACVQMSFHIDMKPRNIISTR